MKSFVQNLESIAQNPDDASAAPLLALIQSLGPRTLEAAGAPVQRLGAMIGVLRSRPLLAQGLHAYLSRLLGSRAQSSLFADLGILGNETIAHAVMRRLVAKILPPAHDDMVLKDLLAVLQHEGRNLEWLREVPEALIAELLKVIGFGSGEATSPADRHTTSELLEALRILSFRLAALGTDPDFLRYETPVANRASPFLAQTEEAQRVIDEAYAALGGEGAWPDARHFDVLLDQCLDHLRRLRRRAHEGGVSVALTYAAFRAGQIIRRMRQLVELLAPGASDAQQMRRIVFYRELLHHEAQKNSIRALLTQVTDLLALRVTEHASRTGEHYVAETRSQQHTLFKAAAGAGLIVAFMALIKLFIARAKLPPLWEALGFSLNYGLGFVLVHFCHCTIATKQPAMTAALIAATMDEGEGKPPLERLEKLVIDVLRSQFIAILGNVLLAFALSLAIGWVWPHLFGKPLVDAAKAAHLLHDIHPLQSPAIFHAAIAGVCLYLSGLISGYYDNTCVYSRIPQRIRQLPWLRRLVGESGAARVAGYVENNLGALAGNFLFGCMLGSMGTIGFLLGLPLDIRHVTFAAANFAYATAALGFQLPWQTVAASVVGVALIGMTNLTVSFSLALITAMKSRQLRFGYGKRLFGMVMRRILRHPQELIVPPRAV